MNKQGAETSADLTLKKLIHTLLYEGYALYPHRGPALKNKTPLPFGVVYPEAFCMQNKLMHCEMQTECIVHGSADTTLDVTVKFLHVSNKAGHTKSSWQGIEREINPGKLNIGSLTQSITILPFRFDKSDIQKEINLFTAIEGCLIIHASEIPAMQNAFRISVVIINSTYIKNTESITVAEVMNMSLIFTHTILKTEMGQFISQQNPPAKWKDMIEQCQNLHTWPVLIDESNNTMLSSPIILHDYPKINRGTAGKLFDSTEIEEALTLHVNTFTENEKREIIHRDEKLRTLMDNINEITSQQIGNPHDTLKDIDQKFAQL